MSLRLESVTVEESGCARLTDLDLRVEEGEIFVVLGPNGCGKSTFLRLCIGLVAPTRGEVFVLGECLHRAGRSRRERVRRQIGFVFQEDALLASLTLRENLDLPLSYASDLAARERRARVDECLALVGLGAEADARPRELSLGKRKRAAMARAIIARPRLLLLDDPTSGLDSLEAYETISLIRSLRRETGAACVVVSNDATRFLRSAGRVAVLFGGRFTTVGRPEEVMNSEDPWLTDVYDKLMRAENSAETYR